MQESRRRIVKRDMDLIKAILIALEKNCDGTFGYQPTRDTLLYKYNGTEAEFNEHCRFIAERGLANYQNDVNKGMFFLALTWDGHNFLDNSRESRVREAVKKTAGNLSLGVFQKVPSEPRQPSRLNSSGFSNQLLSFLNI